MESASLKFKKLTLLQDVSGVRNTHLNKMFGVSATYTSYMGGNLDNPSYHQVKTGTTGHVETVEVLFVNEEVMPTNIETSFETRFYFKLADKGPRYRFSRADLAHFLLNEEIQNYS